VWLYFNWATYPRCLFHLPTLAKLFLGHRQCPQVFGYVLAAVEGFHFAGKSRPQGSFQPGYSSPFRQGKRAAWVVVGAILLFGGGLFITMHRIKFADLAIDPGGHILAVSSSWMDDSIKHGVLLWNLGQAD
jgi:hypothetical protein